MQKNLSRRPIPAPFADRALVCCELIFGAGKPKLSGLLFKAITMREITYQISGNCWHCTSHKPNSDGYPIAKIAGKNCRIGRLFYQKLKGEIPEGKIVRHTCDNRICINPDHLILGTHADNMRDMVERGRAPFGIRHHNAKISEIQVMEIRGNTSDSMMTLARRYDISKSHVWNIKHGVKWRRAGILDEKYFGV